MLIRFFVLALLLTGSVLAQTPVHAPDSSASTSAAAMAAGGGEQSSGPIAVPVMSEKAQSYYSSGNVLWFVNLLWGFLIPALFLFTGFSARIRTWAQRFGKKWFLVIGLYFIIFAVLNFIIDLPLSYYQDYVRQHAYDLSNQTLSKWFGDGVKSLLVGMVMGVLFMWVPYLLLKKSPTRWWLYVGLLMIPFLFFIMLVNPIWVDPLFNDFGPMHNKKLEAQILALADKAGISGGRVFEVNKSVDTKTVNAYVTGFWNTKRIVLWDTIIAKLDEQELLFVMGHEMGHYVLHHVIKSILFFALLIMLSLYGIYRTAGLLLHKHQARFGFDRLDDVASVPLMLLLFSFFTFIITPMAIAFTRYQEHESDRFGLEITQQNRPAAMAFVKLQAENLANPRPGLLYKIWRASHPTLGERIDFCNTYHPWASGQPMKYVALFKLGPAQNAVK